MTGSGKQHQSSARPGAKPPAQSHDVIPLEELDYSGRSRAPCVKCGTSLKPGVPTCPTCGYDPSSVPLEPEKARAILGEMDPDATPASKRKRPKKVPRTPPPPPKCSECGYEIGKLHAQPNGRVTCPECGLEQLIRTIAAVDDETSKEITRWAYLKPGLVLGGFLTGYAILLIAQGWLQGGIASAKSGWLLPSSSRGLGVALRSLASGMFAFAWMTVVALGVTTFLTMAWTGLSTTVRLLLLQVTALMAMACGLSLLLMTLPIPIPGWWTIVVAGIFYAYYLADWQDLYLQDAGIIAAATVGAIWFCTMLAAVL